MNLERISDGDAQQPPQRRQSCSYPLRRDCSQSSACLLVHGFACRSHKAMAPFHPGRALADEICISTLPNEEIALGTLLEITLLSLGTEFAGLL